MAKRSWIAALLVPLAALAARGASAEEDATAGARILRMEARPEAGRTLIRIETTSGSVNYISYTKSPTTTVVDSYGLAADAIPAEVPVGSAEVRAVRFEYSPPAQGYTSVGRFIIERTAAGPTPIHLDGSTLVIEAQAGKASAQLAPGAAHPTASRVAATGRVDAGAPARRIEEILSEARGEDLAITIRGDGKLRYDSFTLNDPPRLVVDIHGVENHVARGQLALEHPAVERVRVSQFRMDPEKVARVVFDLGAPRDYRLVASGDSLRIAFGGDLASAELAEEDAGSAPVALAEAAQGVPPTTPAGTHSTMGESAEATVHGAVEEEEGTLISLDLKDADIKDVLRYFSEISGLNIILDPGVSGTVTVRLIDVPWNKALDIILKSHGYGKTLEGNVLRIAEVSKLTAEESLAAELDRQRLESRGLVTITRPISYADAQQISTVVQQTALSKKGSIIIDARTNTLVITEVDLPEYRQRILDLIKTLDTPTPQVEIEARIVESTKNFAQSFGIQYGFNHVFDQLTGSTTDLVFPNNGVIRGDIVSGGGVTSTLPGGGYAINLPATGGANSAIGFSLGNINETFQLDLALTALEQEGKGRILSAPKITTQSNVAASIVSGASIPVQTVANNTITVQYLPVNLQLNVTPQVTPDNTVILKVVVDNSAPDLSQSIGALGLPPINVRRAQTTLMVPDGGTAVIGGVFQLNENQAQGRIPVVNRIPVIGWLFKNKFHSRVNNELLIFITPKIKRPQGIAAGTIPVAVNPAR